MVSIHFVSSSSSSSWNSTDQQTNQLRLRTSQECARLIIARGKERERNRCWTNYRESHAREEIFAVFFVKLGGQRKEWVETALVRRREDGGRRRREKEIKKNFYFLKKAKEKTVQRSRSHSSQIFFRKLSLVSTPLQISLRSGWMRSFCSLDFRTSFLFSYLLVFH